MDKIIEKIIEMMPFWAVVIICIMFVAMKFYYTRFKTLEDKTSHADCQNKNGKIDTIASDVDGLKRDVDGLKKDVDGLKKDMSDIKDDISTIKGVLIQGFPNALMLFSMKKSPRRLNELGEKIFDKIDGRRFLEDNKDFFFSKIEEMKPKTALDVESAANLACAGSTSNEIFNDIKNFVYNAPSMMVKNQFGYEIPYDITLGDIMFVLSLPLRDMYLEEHPELNA